MRVIVVEPPRPLLSIEEVKAHLRIDGDDEDVTIAGYIATASEHLDGETGCLGRAIGQQLLEARFSAEEAQTEISLRYPPIAEILSIAYVDAGGALRTVDVDTVELLGRTLVPAGAAFAWDDCAPRKEAIRIRYRAGYAVMPAAIRSAALMIVGALYRNRDLAEAVDSTALRALLTPLEVFDR